MKAHLAAAAIAALALTGAVRAADLPARDLPPAAPLPIFTWTGFYVGVNAGYHFGDSNGIGIVPDAAILGPANAALGIVPGSLSPDRDGFLIGGTIGYNFQWTPNFVVGLEADLSYVDGQDSQTFVGGLAQPNFYSVEHGFEWFATVRGRLGFVAAERLMIYATGGLAIADVSRSVTHTNGALGVLTTASSSDTEFGFTIGAGAEWAFTNNLTFKAEYLYYAFEDQNVILNYPAPVAGGSTLNDFETNGHILRAGVNFKF